MAVDPVFRPYEGTRALVVGASGFIGMCVARALHRCGARVILGVRNAASAEALCAEFADHAEVIVFDALDADSTDAAVRAARAAVCFNLVGYGVDRRDRDEALAHAINTEFATRLCHAIAATRAGWPHMRLVQAGTQLEYGPLPALDEAATERPDTLYGITKLGGTRAIRERAAAAALPAVVARIFTVYGPGEPPGRLLPSLIEAAVRGGDLPMTDGTQETDFVHVDDVAEGLLRLALSDAAPGTVVNLASGRLTSVRDFALTAARLLGMDAGRLRFGTLPRRAETLDHPPIGTDRLRALTGWVPKLNVESGIRRTIERYGMINVED